MIVNFKNFPAVSLSGRLLIRPSTCAAVEGNLEMDAFKEITGCTLTTPCFMVP